MLFYRSPMPDDLQSCTLASPNETLSERWAAFRPIDIFWLGLRPWPQSQTWCLLLLSDVSNRFLVNTIRCYSYLSHHAKTLTILFTNLLRFPFAHGAKSNRCSMAKIWKAGNQLGEGNQNLKWSRAKLWALRWPISPIVLVAGARTVISF